MKGKGKVIERLNEALFLELGAVNQYWLHYRLLDDWGFGKLAKKEREESIEEMNHADKLVQRIIFLEGHPNLQVLDPLRIGETVKETLECDLAAELDALARAWQPSRERLREAERQGTAFVQVTADVWDLDLPPMLLPVALGEAARQMDMSVEPVAALYLQSFAGNLVSAAQRLMPLGQTAAQGVLARLAPLCAELAAGTEGLTLEDMASCAFLSDVASMKHETLEPRLFQS